MTTTPKLEPHDLSKFFPPISDDDFDKLAADIKLNGLHQPIMRYQGKILDGNNRYRACELAGRKPTFADFTGIDADARNYVISANIHRRHLSREDRKAIVEMLLKADPTQSNRQIAEQTKASHHTVQVVRDQLVDGGKIAHQTKTVGKDGVAQPTTKRGRGKGKAGSGKSDKETITYKKVVDAKTAVNAYSVLEEHLLDALQDLNDRSSFPHADEYAQGTIKKLQDRLAEMQPEEETAEVEEAA